MIDFETSLRHLMEIDSELDIYGSAVWGKYGDVSTGESLNHIG
jgi:hypothetical protein